MNCLVLIPKNHINLSNSRAKIISLLSELGIIGNKLIDSDDNYYLSGKNYLHYISFLGCSPYLNFKPQKTISASDLNQTIADLNYIQLDLINKHYYFKKTEFGIKAICPACKSKISEWNTLISNWEKTSEINASCPGCQQQISLLDIQWKKTAGFYKSAILLHGIQAELALPTDVFLNQLEKITNVEWKYFYG